MKYGQVKPLVPLITANVSVFGGPHWEARSKKYGVNGPVLGNGHDPGVDRMLYARNGLSFS